MLKWSVVFIVIAVIAAVIGFAVNGSLVAKLLFLVFLVLSLDAFVLGFNIFKRHHH